MVRQKEKEVEYTAACDQPIGQWNTSSVTDMYSMFRSAAAFNQPIDQWNTSSVTNMNYMFYRAAAFKQTIPEEWKNKGALRQT